MKLKFLFSSLALTPLPFTLTTSCINVNDASEPNLDVNVPSIKPDLTFINYWDKPVGSATDIKKKIKTIFDDYRLYEWNKHYQESKDPKQKSKMLNLSFLEYKNNIDQKTIYTDIYKKQDSQFQYFNDFINVFTFDPSDKEEKNFLILRYELLLIEATKKIDSILVASLAKNIRQINLSDWNVAIGALLSSGSFVQLKEIMGAFYRAYILLVKPYLAAQDIYMRFKNKDKDKDWERQYKRAMKIYESANDYWLIFENSLIPSNKNPEPELTPAEVLEMIKGLSEPLKKFVTSLNPITPTIKLSDYYDKKPSTKENYER